MLLTFHKLQLFIHPNSSNIRLKPHILFLHVKHLTWTKKKKNPKYSIFQRYPREVSSIFVGFHSSPCSAQLPITICFSRTCRRAVYHWVANHNSQFLLGGHLHVWACVCVPSQEQNGAFVYWYIVIYRLICLLIRSNI